MMVRAAAVIAAGLALTGCEGRPAAEAERAVRATLRDPSSAQFRGVRVCPATEGWTGEVNSKNPDGVYTGFQVFVVENGKALTMPNPNDQDALAVWVNHLGRCLGG